MAVIVFLVLWRGGPFEMATAIHVVSGGLTISLSVLLGFPAVLLALWIAIRLSGVSFADYLALRWTSWRYLLLGIVAMVVLVIGWGGNIQSRGGTRKFLAAFMVDVGKVGPRLMARCGFWLFHFASWRPSARNF